MLPRVIHTRSSRLKNRGQPAMPRGRFSNSPITQLLETSYSLKNSKLETSCSLKNKRDLYFSPQRPTTEGIFYGFRRERAMLFRYRSRNAKTQSHSSDVAYRICGTAAPWHYGPVVLWPVPEESPLNPLTSEKKHFIFLLKKYFFLGRKVSKLPLRC